MTHSSVYGYWLVDYPHFRSLFVFSHYMKMRWVPTACNSGCNPWIHSFIPWLLSPGSISQQPLAFPEGVSQEISRSPAVFLFEHNGVSSSFHGIATSESLNPTPWLCVFARSKHLLCCQALVLISNSHNVFVPHSLHYLIGHHFWSKGHMVCVNMASLMTLVCFIRNISNYCLCAWFSLLLQASPDVLCDIQVVKWFPHNNHFSINFYMLNWLYDLQVAIMI